MFKNLHIFRAKIRKKNVLFKAIFTFSIKKLFKISRISFQNKNRKYKKTIKNIFKRNLTVS